VIAWSGWQILRVTVPILVDAVGVDADRIRRAAVEVPGVSSAGDVRSRMNSSGTIFAEVTITVDGSLPVSRAHDLADAVERSVASALGTADVTVHVEPHEPHEPHESHEPHEPGVNPGATTDHTPGGA
jgi:ferrous-iron efflux pump FieF